MIIPSNGGTLVHDEGYDGPLDLDDVATKLLKGRVVLHPTESVYGLGSTLGGEGFRALKAAKSREGQGFIVLVPSLESVLDLFSHPVARFLAETFWPGPVTLVVADPKRRFPADVKASDGSVALRVPGHPITLKLLSIVGVPMTSTSANGPGEEPALDPEDGLKKAGAMGLSPVVISGGVLSGRSPSTLIDCRGGKIDVLREGGLSLKSVQEALWGAGFADMANRIIS